MQTYYRTGNTKWDDSRMDGTNGYNYYNPFSVPLSDNAKYLHSLDIDRFTNEDRMWRDENQPTEPELSWNDIEPYIQRLSPVDQIICRAYYQNHYTQKRVGELFNWCQVSIRYRLNKISNILKLLMETAVTINDLFDTDLSDEDKFLLAEYSRCLGNMSEISRNIKLNQCSVRYRILKALKRLGDHPMRERLNYSKYPKFCQSHLGRLFDPVVTRCGFLPQ